MCGLPAQTTNPPPHDDIFVVGGRVGWWVAQLEKIPLQHFHFLLLRAMWEGKKICWDHAPEERSCPTCGGQAAGASSSENYDWLLRRPENYCGGFFVGQAAVASSSFFSDWSDSSPQVMEVHAPHALERPADKNHPPPTRQTNMGSQQLSSARQTRNLFRPRCVLMRRNSTKTIFRR